MIYCIDKRIQLDITFTLYEAEATWETPSEHEFEFTIDFVKKRENVKWHKPSRLVARLLTEYIYTHEHEYDDIIDRCREDKWREKI